MTAIPTSIDRMPEGDGSLDAARLIAFALNSVPYEWWRAHKNEPPLSETSAPVKAVLDGLRIAGYEIVKKQRGDFR